MTGKARTATSLGCWLALAAAGVVIGCRSLEIHKHDPVVVQAATNVIVVAEGGWDADYWSYGLWTTFGNLDIGIRTNGSVNVRISDLNSDVSTNHVAITVSGGEAAGEVAKKVIEALKAEQ